MIELDPTIDVPRLRGALAERRITHRDFATKCDLSRTFVARVLAGSHQPGELARIKMYRGMELLGLNRDEGADHDSRQV